MGGVAEVIVGVGCGAAADVYRGQWGGCVGARPLVCVCVFVCVRVGVRVLVRVGWRVCVGV